LISKKPLSAPKSSEYGWRHHGSCTSEHTHSPAHIDCPEKRGSQPFGNNAKTAFSNLCFGQQVNIYGEKYDRYKRLIAVVANQNKQIVNQKMIKQGMASHLKSIHQIRSMLNWN